MNFWLANPASKFALQTWFEDASRARWLTPQDIKLRYASASFIAPNRVVFNIKGNDYRLIVAVMYQFGVVYIKFLGTHSQYDEIDAATVKR